MPTKPEKQLSPSVLKEMRPERMGYRLMLLREALGLKPSEISDMIDLDRSHWSRYEGGKRRLSFPLVALLEDRFGVTADFLILGKWGKLPVDLAEKMRAIQRRVESSNSGSA